MEWISFQEQLPPEGVTVHTKIDDEHGFRNEQNLTRRGNFMYMSKGDELFNMYVYYLPTYWKYIE